MTAVRVSHSLPNRSRPCSAAKESSYVQSVLRRSRRVRAVVRRSRSDAASPSRSRSRALVDRRRPRRPRRARQVAHRARARRSPSASRSSTASRPTARRPAALILAPTRELATQIVDEIRPIAHARALRVTAVYGGVGLEQAGRRPPRVAHPRRHARPARGPARSAARSTLDARSRSSSSTRPTACSTWASARRSTGSSPPCPARPPDAVLLGHARRRRRPDRRALHERRRRARARAAGRAREREIEHRFVDGRARAPRRSARRRAAARPRR